MKYIITESQNRRLRFIRRMEQFPNEYVKSYVSYIRKRTGNICRFGSFGRFINYLQDEVIQEWMELEDMDYIKNYIMGDMYEELKSYYENDCGK